MEFEVKEKCCLCDVEVNTEDELEIHISNFHPEIIVKEEQVLAEFIIESTTTECVFYEDASLDVIFDENKENVNSSNLDEKDPLLNEVEDQTENQSREKKVWTCDHCPRFYQSCAYLMRHIKSRHEKGLKSHNKTLRGVILEQKSSQASQVRVKTRSNRLNRRGENEHSGIF